MKSVEILLATYRPNKVFFEKLLKSLNDQTYKNLALIVRDDSEDDEAYELVKNYVNKFITDFEFKITMNDKNLGSNKTFEQLTKDSTAEYLAYCDQDDIWEKEKIEKLVTVIKKENSIISYSDLSIIDENDHITANSFKKIHKRLKHQEGEGLFEFFLRRNSVTGCTMLIKSEIAKKAIPFCNDYYVHDHWLTLYSSSVGKIAYVPEPLVKYRIHGGNQIGASMLSNIDNIEEYYQNKLLKEREKFNYLLMNYDFDKKNKDAIKRVRDWTDDRIRFFEKKNLKNSMLMVGKIKDDYQLILFEMGINFLPSSISEKMIRKIRK